MPPHFHLVKKKNLSSFLIYKHQYFLLIDEVKSESKQLLLDGFPLTTKSAF